MIVCHVACKSLNIFHDAYEELSHVKFLRTMSSYQVSNIVASYLGETNEKTSKSQLKYFFPKCHIETTVTFMQGNQNQKSVKRFMCFVLYQMFVEEYLVCCGIHVFTITINSYSLFSHFLLHTRNNYSLLKSSYACEIQLSKKSQTSFYWQQCRYGSKFISIKFHIECETCIRLSRSSKHSINLKFTRRIVIFNHMPF